MEIKSDSIMDKLKELKQEDLARWTYLKAESERQSSLLNRQEGSEDLYKSRIAKAGINIEALEYEERQEEEREGLLFDEIKKVDPPPKHHKIDVADIVNGGVFEIPDTNIWLLPPADSVEGNNEHCGFNAALAEVNKKGRDKGDGWGIMASASGPPEECVLWFHYVPPRAGNLLVEPHIDFQGDVSINAHDHWYTNTSARLKIWAYFDLFQHYWDGVQTATIVDEYRTNSKTAYWVDTSPSMSKSLSVSAGTPVYIKIGIVAEYHAHSSHAELAFDFRTGADRRIAVEYIRLNLT